MINAEYYFMENSNGLSYTTTILNPADIDRLNLKSVVSYGLINELKRSQKSSNNRLVSAKMITNTDAFHWKRKGAKC